jgi:hypothetical protein
VITQRLVLNRYSRIACGALLAAVSALGCSEDIWDVGVQLAPEMFTVDLGSAAATIPTVTCDPQNPTVCGGSQVVEFTGGSGEATIDLGCDAGTALCFAQVDARGMYTVDVLQDDGFTSAVGRKAVSVVRTVDVAVTIPVNTMTFDIPEIDLFVGPPGTAQPTDPGVVPVDTLQPIAAGTTIATGDARHLTVADGSQAHDLIASSIETKTPFVFLLTLAPRLESGTALPAGMLEVVAEPLLGLGLR